MTETPKKWDLKIGNSGERIRTESTNSATKPSRIKYGTVPDCEYFLHRCLQILDFQADKNKNPDNLNPLWQRLSALRRYLSCLKSNKLCLHDKAMTHPVLFCENQEMIISCKWTTSSQ